MKNKTRKNNERLAFSNEVFFQSRNDNCLVVLASTALSILSRGVLVGD
jgi:hypothetical protein